MKIYTKTGDKGETSLFTGDRVPKDDPFINALGTIDECNTAIGAALSFLPKELEETRSQLIYIQHALFDLGAAVATPRSRATEAKIKKTGFDAEGTQKLEQWIDAMEKDLPSLHTFILPGGHPAAALLHMARSACRSAERCLIPLLKEITPEVLIYLNRLSDYLFVATRAINAQTHTSETLWEKLDI